MPSRKKKNKKRRSKTKSRAPSMPNPQQPDAQSDESNFVPVPDIPHKQEATLDLASAKEIVDWLVSDRITAKTLSKKLPALADQIRNGEASPEDIVRIVKNAKRVIAKDTILKNKPNLANAKECFYIRRIERQTGIEPLLADLVRIACGPDHNLQNVFIEEFIDPAWIDPTWSKINLIGPVRKTIRTNDKRVTELKNPELIRSVQEAYDRTCMTCATTKHRALSFGAFVEVLAGLIRKNEDLSLEGLIEKMVYDSSKYDVAKTICAAAKGVQSGWDRIRCQCWQCGKFHDNILKCSKCQAARYCSPECQHKAWKEGHKHACSDLKDMYQLFLSSYHRVDQAVKPRKIEGLDCVVDGYTLPQSGARDYQLLPMILSQYSLPVVPASIDLVAQGTISIDHMYNSIADIFQGKAHWMFEDSFQHSGDFKARHPCEIESHYMMQAMILLSVNLSKIEPSSAVPDIKNSFLNQLRRSSTNKGDLMSANRFVEIFLSDALGSGKAPIPAVRTETLANCMTIMRKHFHKKKKKSSFNVSSLLRTLDDISGVPLVQCTTSDGIQSNWVSLPLRGEVFSFSDFLENPPEHQIIQDDFVSNFFNQLSIERGSDSCKKLDKNSNTFKELTNEDFVKIAYPHPNFNYYFMGTCAQYKAPDGKAFTVRQLVYVLADVEACIDQCFAIKPETMDKQMFKGFIHSPSPHTFWALWAPYPDSSDTKMFHKGGSFDGDYLISNPTKAPIADDDCVSDFFNEIGFCADFESYTHAFLYGRTDDERELSKKDLDMIAYPYPTFLLFTQGLVQTYHAPDGIAFTIEQLLSVVRESTLLIREYYEERFDDEQEFLVFFEGFVHMGYPHMFRADWDVD